MAVRAPLVVHDGATVMQVLDTFKNRLVQMGLIYDEYGALRGVVTQADLLEALAGDTYGFAEAEYARLLAPQT